MKTRMAAKRERIHAHLARMRFTDADREVHEFHMKDCEGKLPENLVATGGTDKAVRLWDAENGKHVRDLLGHEREVNSVAFFKDKSPEQGEAIRRPCGTATGQTTRRVILT